MQLKGRHWVVLWLLAFLAVAAIVIARQTRSYALATTLRQTRDRRMELEARAAELRRAIQEASGRAAIGRKAEALGLRFATGSEYQLLPMPAAPPDR